MTTEVTALNGMLGRDFSKSLETHQELGLHLLDLKDNIFGKHFIDLTLPEAQKARQLIDASGLKVYALSSSLCHADVEFGETAFRLKVAKELDRVLDVAHVLRPSSVRLLSATTTRRRDYANSIAYLDQNHPWIYDVYRECIDTLLKVGYKVFIENEVGQNVFSTPTEILQFFERLDCGDRAQLTWDIQNLWEMGTPPSLAVYDALRPLIGYLHFKGGRAGLDGRLETASDLKRASWPVADIVRRALADGSVSVFCVNPSHGFRSSAYESLEVAKQDICYLQKLISAPTP